MSIESKIKELLAERAAPGPKYQEKGIMQGSSVIAEPSGELEDLGGAETAGVAASAKAGEMMPPGGGAGGEKGLVKQGSSDEPQGGTEDEEDLSAGDPKAPGVAASAKAGAAMPPGGPKGGEKGLVKQGSSDTPTPGQDTPAPGPMPGVTEEEKKDIEKILSEAGVPAEALEALVEAFETAVVTRVEAELDAASDTLAEAVHDLSEANKEELVENVNAYLNYAVEQWMEKNEVAIETGLRAEIAESFIEGLRQLFTEHAIEVPEENYDPLVAATKKNEELEAKLNESLAATVALTEANRTLERRQIVERASRSLTVVDAEKFSRLVEEVEFDDAKTFEEKVGALKERYFAKTPGSKTTLTESNDEPIVEEVTGPLAATARLLSRAAKK